MHTRADCLVQRSACYEYHDTSDRSRERREREIAPQRSSRSERHAANAAEHWIARQRLKRPRTREHGFELCEQVAQPAAATQRGSKHGGQEQQARRRDRLELRARRIQDSKLDLVDRKSTRLNSR